MKRIILILLGAVAAVVAVAQNGESQLNSSYQAAIRQYLEEDMANREQTMRQRAEQVLVALPNQRKLYDESLVNITSRIVDTLLPSGEKQMDCVFDISYNCRHEEGYTDDYPLGVYSCDSSNSVIAICQLTKMFVEGVLDDVFRPGKEVTVKITSSADGTDIASALPYGGEYGDFRYMPVVFNGEPLRISVDRRTGIANNAQLAYVRAQSVRDYLEKQVRNLANTRNNYRFVTRSYADTGAHYRRSSIELRVHDAFRETVDLMTADKIQDDYVDFNIPQSAGSYENAYVLIIANEDYSNTFLPNVPYARHDAETVRRYFVRALGVPERQVKVLSNATRQQVLDEGVHWLTDISQAVATKRGDALLPVANVFVYYAGHGYTDFDNVPYLMLNNLDADGIKALGGASKCGKKRGQTADMFAEPNFDIVLSGKESGKFTRQLLSIEALVAAFKGYPIQNLTLILDAGFDGMQRNGNPMLRADRKADSKRRRRKPNLRGDAVVLMAADIDRTAYAFDAQHHGFLTYFLLKEVKGMAGHIEEYTYQDIYEAVYRKLNKESALQGRWQEASGLAGGKYKTAWQQCRIK